MRTVTITRTVTSGRARNPRETGLQYVSLDELTAALRGELTYGMRAVSRRRGRTWAGARVQARRARRPGTSATIARGDPLAGLAGFVGWGASAMLALDTRRHRDP